MTQLGKKIRQKNRNPHDDGVIMTSHHMTSHYEMINKIIIRKKKQIYSRFFSRC